MNMRNFAVYLPLLGAVACGPSAPKNEAAPEPRQAEYIYVAVQVLRNHRYIDVTRNGVTERKYPTHTCLIEPSSDSHISYCDLESNGKGLDSVSRVIRATDQNGQDRWIDGTTDYATDAFSNGFYLEDIFSPMTEPMKRKSPEFTALEKGYALAQENFNKVHTK